MQRPNPAGAIDIKVRAFAPEKRPVLEERQHPLAPDRVRYPGEAVAMVVADSIAAARDAAEAVEVEYEVLPAVTDVRGGDRRRADLAVGARQRRARSGFRRRRRGAGGVRVADLVVEETFRNQRIVNAQMEPRSGVGSYDHGEPIPTR